MAVPSDFVLRLLTTKNSAVCHAAVEAFGRQERSLREAQAEDILKMLDSDDREIRQTGLAVFSTKLEPELRATHVGIAGFEPGSTWTWDDVDMERRGHGTT
eukprot:7366054-Prymnesium_polylepis.1